MVDHFTKYVWIAVYEKQSAENVRESLLKWFKEDGQPERALSDNGSEFIGHVITQMLIDKEIKESHGRPHHPQSQGVVERMNGTVKKSLNKIISEAGIKEPSIADADYYAERVQNQLRNNKHSVTRFIPFVVGLY